MVMPKLKSGEFTKLTAALSIASLLLLTGCGPQDGSQRPDDALLKKVIHQLMNNYCADFPQSISWDSKKVDDQLNRPMPKGFQTEAGWFIEWKDYAQGELAYAYAPWFLLGQYPNNLQSQNHAYTGGKDVPTSVQQAVRAAVIRAKAIPENQYFSAFVNVKYSATDRQDRKSTRLNSSHIPLSRMPSSA